MKKILLFIAVATISLNLCGQDKGYFGISIGPSIPLGDLADTDLSNRNAGFATTGFATDITYAYVLGRYVGLTASLRTQRLSSDADAFLNAFRNDVDATSALTVSMGNWASTGILFGAYMSFPLGERFSLDGKLQLAVMYSEAPRISLTQADPTIDFYQSITQSRATSIDLGYSFGIGLKFIMNDKVCLMLNSDYMTVPSEYSADVTSNTNGNSSYEFNTAFNTANITLGIGYRLKAKEE